MTFKLISALVALSASSLFAAPVAVRTLDPIEVASPIEKIFIPEGFDDNDNIEVVLHGNFPNTCYTVGRASATVDNENHEIVVKATAYKYPGKLCLQSITPFIQTVTLGLLNEGNYTVRMADKQNLQKEMLVSKRKTESADDYLYATVENAGLQIDADSGKQAVKLSGHFPYFFVGCMVLRDVKVKTAPSDVLVVQPIAEIVDNEECQNQPADRSFEYTAGLTEAFRGEGLLHVRTLDGNSINRYINVDRNGLH